MIPSNLRIALAAALAVYFILILIFLKKKAIELKYTLLWLLAGLWMALLVIFPTLLPGFIHLFGITDNMNGLFIFCIAFLMMLVMELTSIVSRQAFKIRCLTQGQAMLEREVRELKKSAAEGHGNKAVRETEDALEEEKRTPGGKELRNNG